MFANRWPLLTAAMVAAATAIGACGGSDDGGGGDTGSSASAPAGKKTSLQLKVGVLLPLTGALADFAPPGRKAADLALRQIKQAAGAAGADHEVTAVYEDTQTDPQGAVSAARKVVAEGATCTAGPWASSEVIPVAESVTVREKVLTITPSATGDAITDLDDDGLVFRVPPPDNFQGPALADVIEQSLGAAEGKTINIGARNDAYGTGLTDTFTRAWQEKGGAIGQKVIYDTDQPSYNSEAQQIVSGNPDAWVIIDFPETYVKVGPALVRAGFDTKKGFVTDGLKSGDLPKDAGREATEGLRGTVPGVPDEDPAAQAFDKLWTDAGGAPRQTFDAQNFDTVILCYLAAVAAGSTEGPAMAEQVRAVSGPPGKKLSWNQLGEAVTALQNGEDIDYQGASGPIDLNEAGDATAGVYDIYEYRGGKVVSTDEIALKP